MKKNAIAVVSAVALVLLAVPTVAFANGMQQAWSPMGGAGSLAHHAVQEVATSDAAAAVGDTVASVRGVYVDADNNGVCDNRNDDQSRPGYADADSNGICDNRADGEDQTRPGYIDADSDGVCDNYDGSQQTCPGYVDANNDGSCDNYGSGACAGSGCGVGNGNGAGNGAGYGNGFGAGNGNGNGGGFGCMRR